MNIVGQTPVVCKTPELDRVRNTLNKVSEFLFCRKILQYFPLRTIVQLPAAIGVAFLIHILGLQIIAALDVGVVENNHQRSGLQLTVQSS